MEGFRRVLMVCLVLQVLLVGQSTASFATCYASCFGPCVITNTAFDCNAKCLKNCIFPSSTDLASLKDTQNFCKLGCATSLCANLSSKENPGEQKVGSCVDACSKTCAAEKN